MDRDDTTQRITRLLAELEASAPEGDTLDPNDVARLAAGRPGADVRAVIERRMGAEDARITAAIAAADDARRRAAGRWRLQVAAAAVLALALGGWLVLGRGEARVLTEEDVGLAFAALARAEPDALAGISPLGADATAVVEPPIRRGGLDVLGPRGTVLDPRPRLAWVPVRGAAAYEVEVVSDLGLPVLATTTPETSLPWPAASPALDAGRGYLLRVVSSAAGVRIEGSRAFRVADEAKRARYARILAAIDADVQADLRAVVRAQVAVRLDLLAEAERVLEGSVPEPAAALAEATRRVLHARHGTR